MQKRSMMLIACLVIIIAAGGLYIYRSSFMNTKTAEPYDNLADFRATYQADAEISEAMSKYSSVKEPARLITGKGKADGKEVILTLDGMAGRGVTEGMLEVLKKHNMKAAFFLEGSSAGLDPKLTDKIKSQGQIIGNYSFVGVTKAERLSKEMLMEEFCRAQKVLKITTGSSPDYFKLGQTVYKDHILRSAKASGLSYGVQSGIFVPADKLNNEAEADKFVAGLRPGMIVSLVVGKPSGIKFTTKKKEDIPAIDKKPTIKDEAVAMSNLDLVKVLDRLCTALEKNNYKVAELDSCINTAVKAQAVVKPASESAAVYERVNQLQATAEAVLDKMLGVKVAYAAPAAKKTKDLSAGLGDDYLVQLQHSNKGVLAVEEKMLYTTEQSVPFVFTGFSNTEALDYVLQALSESNSRGTFFVSERELERNSANIDKIVQSGQEIGIAIYPRASETFSDICRDIKRVENILSARYGITTNLVKQSSGAVRDETREATAALGKRLIGSTINVVQTRHKDYKDAPAVLSEIFGKSVFSVGRGWLISIRTDFYAKPSLAAEVMLELKRKKIDNIAYNAYNDIYGINPGNNSGYLVRPVGEILEDTSKEYSFPVAENNYLPQLKRYPKLRGYTDEELIAELAKRYIGEKTVNGDDRTLGFKENEMSRLDQTGLIKTDLPVVFFTFDDWGTDAAINKLLYVLRKHKVKATFFVLTNNVLSNPNLLRAVALEGHEIGSHTDTHKAMVIRDKNGKEIPTMTYEAYYRDLNNSFEKLQSVVGDVTYQGQPVLKKYFRAPTLAISRMGLQAVLENGFEYIISGSTSTADYDAKDLKAMIERVRDGLYTKGKVKNGAIFVMHMSDSAKYTATALDIIFTENEKKSNDDPTKFIVGNLSDYLTDGYSQAPSAKEKQQKGRRIAWW